MFTHSYSLKILLLFGREEGGVMTGSMVRERRKDRFEGPRSGRSEDCRPEVQEFRSAS